MELGLVWECPVGVEEIQLPSLVSTLVQSGIKLFLHQRNQIPLPLEQMQKRNSLQQEQMREEDVHRRTCQSVEEQRPTSLSDEEEQEQRHIKEHVKFMISQRRKNLNNLRRRRIAEKISKREGFAVESITKCLTILDKQIQDNFSNIVAAGLFFGSSIHTAKEIVLFDLSTIMKGLPSDLTNVTEVERGENDRGKEWEQYVSNLTRHFYKGIIMTDEFCDMTEKNLRSTRTHVCLLSSKQFSSLTTDPEVTEDPVLLLDNVEIFTDYISLDSVGTSLDESSDSTSSTEHQAMNTSGLSNDSFNKVSAPPSSRNGNRKRKVLKIRLDMKTNNNSTNQPLPIIRNNCNDECLFCYQIPLRLKGILCKNTFK